MKKEKEVTIKLQLKQMKYLHIALVSYQFKDLMIFWIVSSFRLALLVTFSTIDCCIICLFLAAFFCVLSE